MPAFVEPAAVAKQTRAWRAAHEREILTEFTELLSIPNLATDAPNINRNAEKTRAMCEKRGLTVKLLTIEGAPPVVVADFPAPRGERIAMTNLNCQISYSILDEACSLLPINAGSSLQLLRRYEPSNLNIG